MSKRSRTLSPLDVLSNKSPNNIITQQGELRRLIDSQAIKDVEADTADEITPDAGLMSRSGLGAYSDGTFTVRRLSSVEHSTGSTYTEEIPPGILLDDNIIEIEMTGRLLNNTGVSRNALARIYLGPSGDEYIITSENVISVSTATSYKSFTYKVRIQQAPCLGNFVQCDDELRIGTLTPIINSTITELAGNIEDEMVMFLRLGFSGATSYVNIRWIYNTLTIKFIDGTSGYDKIFWSQPTGTRGYDTRINSNSATTNFGNDTVLHIGESSSASSIGRTLIKFSDISNIPSNAVIDSGYLWLCIESDSSVNARTYDLYRVLRAWTQGDGTAGSGATWNTYNGISNWATAGCGNSTTDYDGSVVLASVSLTATEALGTMIAFVFDTAELQKFIDGTYANNGWLIKAQTETDDRYHVHSADTLSTALAPLLEVHYHFED